MTSYINTDQVDLEPNKVRYMADQLKLGGYDVEYTDEPGLFINKYSGEADPNYEQMPFQLWIKYIAEADMHAAYYGEAEVD